VPAEATDPSRKTQREASKIGRQLAAAAGFRVAARDGAELGQVDHVRYGRRVDRPDEIVVRKMRFLRWRMVVIPFGRIEEVDLRKRLVVVRQETG
jgi:hypothetical protein